MKSRSLRKDQPAKAKPLGAGHGSFDRIDSASLFKDLRLKKGSAFLDVCCGRGDYLVAAAPLVGPEGSLYAVDLWKEGIAALTGEARARGIKNISAKVADVGKTIPFADGSADAALLAVVLHDLVEEGKESKALQETARVLKPGGLLAVVEFKKIDAELRSATARPAGAPARSKIWSAPFGFRKVSFRDLGPDLYELIFRPPGEAAG